MVSRRTRVVSCSIRRRDHPSRPRAMTCCFFASLKTFAMSREATYLPPKSMSRTSLLKLAAFQVTLIGRFWVTPEAIRASEALVSGLASRVAGFTTQPEHHAAGPLRRGRPITSNSAPASFHATFTGSIFTTTMSSVPK